MSRDNTELNQVDKRVEAMLNSPMDKHEEEAARVHAEQLREARDRQVVEQIREGGPLSRDDLNKQELNVWDDIMGRGNTTSKGGTTMQFSEYLKSIGPDLNTPMDDRPRKNPPSREDIDNVIRVLGRSNDSRVVQELHEQGENNTPSPNKMFQLASNCRLEISHQGWTLHFPDQIGPDITPAFMAGIKSRVAEVSYYLPPVVLYERFAKEFANVTNVILISAIEGNSISIDGLRDIMKQEGFSPDPSHKPDLNQNTPAPDSGEEDDDSINLSPFGGLTKDE